MTDPLNGSLNDCGPLRRSEAGLTRSKSWENSAIVPLSSAHVWRGASLRKFCRQMCPITLLSQCQLCCSCSLGIDLYARGRFSAGRDKAGRQPTQVASSPDQKTSSPVAGVDQPLGWSAQAEAHHKIHHFRRGRKLAPAPPSPGRRSSKNGFDQRLDIAIIMMYLTCICGSVQQITGCQWRKKICSITTRMSKKPDTG